MRNVLIISELFFPLNRIGAVRPTKLAKYLCLKKYNVTVFTSANCIQNSEDSVTLPYRVIYANKSKSLVNATSDAQTTKREKQTKLNTNRFINDILQEMKMTKRQMSSYKKGKEFLYLFCNYVDSGSIQLEEFDCVFSTFGPIGSLLCGLEAKRRKPSIVWINDFRDPMVSQIMPKTFAPYYNYLQRKSINLADYTVTVSEGYKKRLSFSGMKGNISVIPNGFDTDDLLNENSYAEDGMFSFAYVGALYEGKRDISALFMCLKKLIDNKVLKSNSICFHYAGSEGNILKSQARKYQLENIIIDHGLVSRQDCLKLQSEVRFLVLSTWNDIGEEGVFPGKLLEYMLMNKPIVSIVGGSLINSEVTRVIRDLSLGISIEKSDNDANTKLYEWLYEQAVHFNDCDSAFFVPDRHSINQAYDWNNIVERFCELING